jgi:hypothetical protein
LAWKKDGRWRLEEEKGLLWPGTVELGDMITIGFVSVAVFNHVQIA